MSERQSRDREAQLPSHPESEDTTPYDLPTTPSAWSTRIVIAVAVILVAIIVVLHLTGVVGPGAH